MVTEVEEWCLWMDRSRGLLPNTRKLYRRTLETFDREVGDPAAADADDIREWLIARDVSASSFSNAVSALRSYYRFLIRKKIRLDDPTLDIDTPKKRKSLPKPVRDLEATLTNLDVLDAKVRHRRVGETRDMVVFLCETGLRISEAVSCTWPVPCPPAMSIIGKGRKEAMIPVTEKAQQAWANLGGHWPITARATQRRLEKVGIHPHMCRHWRGTSMAEAGADVGDIQHMLRHSSPATTLGYAEWNVQRVASAVAKVPA